MDTPNAGFTRRFSRLAPDGLAAAFILSLLATAGFYYVNIMAAIVSGLVDGLHFSAREAGRIGACNIYGAAIGAFCAVLLVRRIVWRPAAVFLLCTLICLDLWSTLIHAAGLLTVVRLLHGLTGGLLVGISFAVFARTRSPDRCFGALMVVQSSLGGLGLMFLPRLVPVFGASVLFLALAAFSLLALMFLPLLPDYAAQAVAPTSRPTAVAARPTFSVALIIALLAVFFFQAGNMALAAYIIELGRAEGLGLGFITATIGVSGWIATAGAVLVIALGTRWGRTLPVAIGMLLALAGNAAFGLSSLPMVFLAANIATAILWFFVIPYLLGLCAAFDRSGRCAALGGLFSKLGLASGPYLAGLLLGNGTSYGPVVTLAVAALALSAVCGIISARQADKIGAAAAAAP